ncbi:MAG: hypothetical protein GY756_09990 [bacterium]|nr:hypothetical protein [bacterium]
MLDDISFLALFLYVSYRILSAIFSYVRIYRQLEYKRIKVAGNTFIIRKISPLDFVEESAGFPLSLFQVKKGETLFEQVAGDNDIDYEDELKKRLALSLMIADKAIVRCPTGLKPQDFFSIDSTQEAQKIGQKIYTEIIALNFKYLYRCYNAKKGYVLHVAELCAKFGKSPHEHLKKNSNMTDIESYLIDEFFYNILLNKENAIIEKRNRNLRKNK